MSAWGASLRRVLTFTWAWLRFTDYYVLQFLQANLEVFWEIVRPRPAMEPGLVAVPLACRTSREIVMLANLLTLTPGTLVIEISLEPPILYVHGMFVHDREAFIAEVHELEARMLRALHPLERRGG